MGLYDREGESRQRLQSPSRRRCRRLRNKRRGTLFADRTGFIRSYGAPARWHGRAKDSLKRSHKKRQISAKRLAARIYGRY